MSNQLINETFWMLRRLRDAVRQKGGLVNYGSGVEGQITRLSQKKFWCLFECVPAFLGCCEEDIFRTEEALPKDKPLDGVMFPIINSEIADNVELERIATSFIQNSSADEASDIFNYILLAKYAQFVRLAIDNLLSMDELRKFATDKISLERIRLDAKDILQWATEYGYSIPKALKKIMPSQEVSPMRQGEESENNILLFSSYEGALKMEEDKVDKRSNYAAAKRIRTLLHRIDPVAAEKVGIEKPNYRAADITQALKEDAPRLMALHHLLPLPEYKNKNRK